MTAAAQCVLILVTSSPCTLTRCAAPFHIATLLACLEAQATFYLTGEATELATVSLLLFSGVRSFGGAALSLKKLTAKQVTAIPMSHQLVYLQVIFSLVPDSLWEMPK